MSSESEWSAESPADGVTPLNTCRSQSTACAPPRFRGLGLDTPEGNALPIDPPSDAPLPSRLGGGIHAFTTHLVPAGRGTRPAGRPCSGVALAGIGGGAGAHQDRRDQFL